MQERFNSLFKSKKFLYLLSFIIPVILCSISFLLLSVEPFGKYSFVFSDAEGSYLPFISYLIRVIKGQDSLLYTFSKGIGANAYSLFAYYLVNPLLLIFYFFDITSYSLAFSILIILQFGFCGLTMFIFLSFLFGNNHKNLIFSTIYALTGYSVVFCWNIMWTGCVILLPLISLGLIKLVKEKEMTTYFIFFSLAIISNFYISFSIAFFCLFFFIVLLYVFNKFNKDIIYRFVFSSLGSGFCSSFLWLPTLISLKNSRMQGISLSDYALPNHIKLIEFFSKFFPGAMDFNEFIYGSPNVFCTIFVILLVIAFFLNNTMEKRFKMPLFFLILIYIVSFFFPPLANIFHGFTKTYGLNFRYSFIFSFLLISIANYQFLNISQISYAVLKRIFATIIIIATVVIITKPEFSSDYLIILEVFLTYILVKLLYIKSPNTLVITLKRKIIFLIPFISLVVNFYGSYKPIKGLFSESNKVNYNFLGLSAVADGIKKYDDSFYRMEVPATTSSGSGAILFGYNGSGGFSSTESWDVILGLKNFGISQSTMRNFYSLPVPATMDSALGIKYLVTTDKENIDEKKYEKKLNIFNLCISQNPNALPVAFLSPNNNFVSSSNLNAFEFQNQFWKSITGESQNVFTPENNATITASSGNEISTKINSSTTTFPEIQMNVLENKPSDDSNNFKKCSGTFTISFTATQNGPIYIQEEYRFDTYVGTIDDNFVYLGTFKKGDKVSKEFSIKQPLSETGLEYIASHLPIYYENQDILEKYAKSIQNQNISINRIKGNVLEGIFTTEEDSNIVFTIPYDKNWKIKVDGKAVEATKFANFMFSVPVPSGTHKISLVFTPPLLYFSVFFSILSAIIYFLGSTLFFNKKKSKDGNVNDSKS